MILHGDDPPVTGCSVVLHGGDVERLDGEGVHHTDVDSLIVMRSLLLSVSDTMIVNQPTFSASVSAALIAS